MCSCHRTRYAAVPVVVIKGQGVRVATACGCRLRRLGWRCSGGFLICRCRSFCVSRARHDHLRRNAICQGIVNSVRLCAVNGEAVLAAYLERAIHVPALVQFR